MIRTQSSPSSAASGLILFAHGSRDPIWREPLETMAANIAQQAPHLQVACAYLELCEPELRHVAHHMVQDGVTHIRVLPMFFGVGKHAREDLPLLMQQLQQDHPQVQFVCEEAVGQHPLLVQAIAAIATASLG